MSEIYVSEHRDKIMIVDDENINIAILSQILSPEYDLITAMNGNDALKLAETEQPDLILLDIVMSGMNGFDVIRKLKSFDATKDIPVIIITGQNNLDDEEKAFLLGAVDYMTKPFNNTIVITRIETHLRIVRQRKEIEQLNLADSLTGLSNRQGFDKFMELEWRRAIREKKALSLLIIDIDSFKAYNEAYGHVQGDELLKAIASVFTKCARRSSDLSARISGEEFAILLPDTAWEFSLLIAENVRKNIRSTILPTIDGKIQTSVTVSIGLVTKTPTQSDSIEDFFDMAYDCMSEAKLAGRDRIIGKVM